MWRPTVALLLALSSSAAADIVLLKSGQRLEGELSEKGGAVELKTEHGTLEISKTDIQKVVRSPEAITRDAEETRDRARALYDEALKLSDLKAANAKLKDGLALLQKVAELYAEAVEAYPGEKYARLSDGLIKTYQERRLYRDKMSSEVAEAQNNPPPPPPPPSVEKSLPEPAKPVSPPEPPRPASPKPNVSALLVKANAGDLEAMFALGNHYDTEEGRIREALRWLKPAAERNHPRAQDRLGLLYRRGNCGIQQDNREALKWFQRASDNGSPFGTFRIAALYYDGAGVKKNLDRADVLGEKAYRPLRALAERGDPEAQQIIAWMHLVGIGTWQHKEEAFKWAKRSADQGYAHGCRQLAWLFHDGSGCTKSFEDAVFWFQKAIDKGDARAINELASVHNDLDKPIANPHRNYELAVSLYRKLVESDDAHGYYNLGLMLMQGNGVAKNEAEGLRLWRKALEGADDAVVRHLNHSIAYLYLNGLAGLKKDVNEAIRHYKIAADAGFALAMTDMGGCYRNLKNDREAAKWYAMAAKAGDYRAQNQMGWYCHNGIVVKKDLNEAERWYIASAQQGFDVAAKNLQLVRDEKARIRKP
jgi:TPR repeat protein